MIKIVIIIFTLCVSMLLFHKAAGTLSISKLNIVSFAFYNLLIFSFIGASLVLLGFRDHYLIAKINSEEVIYKTYAILAYTMIAFPGAIAIFTFLCYGKGIRSRYEKFLNETAEYNKNENLVFGLIVLCTCIGLAATAYTFYCIGSIPILSLLRSGVNTSAVRGEITRNFAGNYYIRNVIMLTLTPLLSYFSYIYFRLTRKIKWGLLFGFNLILSILIKTYNFEKAPIVYYIFYYYIVEILLGNKKLLKKLVIMGIAGVLIIYLQYVFISGYKGNFLTLSSGPGGRIFMTQISTLFLHIQAFPEYIPFLKGASLPTVLAKLIGISSSWIRSGREVMKLYNAAGVQAGIAGSMNALFVGEAYANWGIFGVIVAPIVVAIPFAITFVLLLKLKKTPLTMILYLSLFISLTGSLQGGFVDYLYNLGAILIVLLVLLLYILVNKGKLPISRPLKFKRYI